MTVKLGSYPVGELYADVEEGALCALLIDAQRPIEDARQLNRAEEDVFTAVKCWFDSYFQGHILLPDSIPLSLKGSEFQRIVWDELKKIPPGHTTTYGAIAKELQRKTGRRMSARAVGGAVGKNPVPILLPCHRVIGSDGRLTGYTGGLDRKIQLLEQEGFFVENGRVLQR